MAIRKIARMGHPVLREQARNLTPEELKSPTIRQLIQDMVETMEEYGGIGIAAPQVREPLRLALIGYDSSNSRYEDEAEEEEDQPLLVIANPKVTILDPTLQGYWEGCLSVPELRGYVERPRKIRVDYLDLDGKSQSLEAEGFLATVFQHELDHLDGVLFIDRIKTEPGKTRLAFTEEFSKYDVAGEDEEVLED